MTLLVSLFPSFIEVVLNLLMHFKKGGSYEKYNC